LWATSFSYSRSFCQAATIAGSWDPELGETIGQALGEEALKKLADLLKWLMTWGLKIILYLFTGYIGLTGVVSGTTDAAAMKAAKLTVSGMIPVVGGILSDASEAVLIGADAAKNAVGIYGMLAVLAIGFVAVCLLTSPTVPAAPVPVSETVPEETEPRGYAERLSVGEIAYTCENAIESLLTEDSYCIQNTQRVTDVDAGGRQSEFYMEFRKHGENFLTSVPDSDAFGGSLTFEGQLADFMGDQWLWMGDAAGYEDADAWLEEYSPQGKVVTFPEGTGILSADTVAYHVEWSRKAPFLQNYSGVVSCTFLEDGTLTGLHRVYSYFDEEGRETRYENTLTIVPEEPEVTDQTIRQVAEQVLTQEQLEEYRRNLEVIDKVPSNKTDYDKDFALGSGSKQWKFMGEDYHVRIAAENATATGLTMVYNEADDLHSSLTAENGYWLEKLIDGTWYLVRNDFEKAELAAERIDVTWTTSDSIAIDWTDAYGALESGSYRIGRYHTMTQPSGESETAVCYAKFRLYDPNQDVLLAKCRNAMQALLDSDSYHLYIYDWMPELPYDYYLNEEIWKSGENFLMDIRYPYRDNLWELKGRSGSMRRDGTCYNLEWAGDSITSPITNWTTNTYMDNSNLELWTMNFEWYDSRVEQVREQGNKITIVETYDYDDTYACSENVLTFDDTGALKGMIRSYLPQRDCPAEEKVIQCEMIVFDDSASDIDAVIQNQDVSRPGSFSYTHDMAEYPDGAEYVRTKNFVNTTKQTMDTVLEVIDRALHDCTLPAAADMEPGTNVSKVFYDEAAKIWKVEFTASWDSRIYQAVYLSDQGITQRTVTLELEVEY